MGTAAEPARIASAAGLPHTFNFLGTAPASAADAALCAHRTGAAGRHDPAPRMPAGSAPLLATDPLDHSPKPNALARSGRA
ncbi:hypothetical protein [Streptomyces sp. NBC_00847]|uniref:hypothetical protein n=1 Tax=Streptomyces sp. NBC_00847 TaxID=2975850 RepID=UPI00225207DF|nr:hypothetical protein [Streptomyces sp. NBC_00847]MCX4878431.1 hypothetical protein [Streptomyces sp. NBC_00847]